MRRIIDLNGVEVSNPDWRLREPVTFSLEEGENIAVIGSNGGGKTLLINTITGSYPISKGAVGYSFSSRLSQRVSDNIQYLGFTCVYGAADYYQQRWNSTDQEESPFVFEIIGKNGQSAYLGEIVKVLNLERIVDKRLIHLSNGELRKFSILKALLSRPEVLIVDDPFIGLDAGSRDSLEQLFMNLFQKMGISIIVALAREDYLPGFVTHIVSVEGLICESKISVGEYMDRKETDCFDDRAEAGNERKTIKRRNESHVNTGNSEIIRLNEVSIKYGDKIVLDKVNWVVYRGERWALLGDNGAGKSTVLGLICADNPQAYACDISLFGTRRGSGESIRDIKKQIGYVSPEIHRSFQKDYSVIEVVASGFTDFMGLFIIPGDEQVNICRHWMNIFGVLSLEDRSFLRLSSGEQRLVLLARAFVKNPDLLILDEPMHGLDCVNIKKVKGIIESYLHDKDKTLIMVTHYIDDLPCNDMNSIVLDNGKVIGINRS